MLLAKIVEQLLGGSSQLANAAFDEIAGGGRLRENQDIGTVAMGRQVPEQLPDPLQVPSVVGLPGTELRDGDA